MCAHVSSLCFSDVQGTGVGPGVFDEVKSALGLPQHVMIWVACGHWSVVVYMGPTLEPVAIVGVASLQQFFG